MIGAMTLMLTMLWLVEFLVEVMLKGIRSVRKCRVVKLCM